MAIATFLWNKNECNRRWLVEGGWSIRQLMRASRRWLFMLLLSEKVLNIINQDLLLDVELSSCLRRLFRPGLHFTSGRAFILFSIGFCLLARFKVASTYFFTYSFKIAKNPDASRWLLSRTRPDSKLLHHDEK